MALNTNTPTGPVHPGVVTNAGNDRAVTALVASSFVAKWANRPAHAEVANRGFQSEWAGTVHGDTMVIPVMPRYRLIQGYTNADADTFQRQKELAPTVTLTMRQPSKLETAKDIFDRGMYTSPKLEMQKAERKVESLIDGVETDIARIERAGYQRGAQAVSTTTAPTRNVCVAPGPDSTNLPSFKAYTAGRATLTALGVTGREYCGLLSPDAMESFTRASLAGGYEYPWGGEAARKGMAPGMGRLGWKFVESVHNGVYGYTDPWGTAAITVRTSPGAGTRSVNLQGSANNKTLPAGTFLQFAGSNSVNQVLGDDAPMLEGYQTTAAVTFDSAGRATVTVDHDIDSRTTGEFKRTRNCTAQPAAGARVFVNGLDTGVEANRQATVSKTVSQSFLVARDSCALVVAQPELPTDTQRARMISVNAYRVAAAHINWFDGPSKQIRDSLLMRVGPGVLEPVAGIVIFGAESGAQALL